MSDTLSVIICTHNPRQDYLARVLDALKRQTLPRERWELLLVDNASKEPLAKIWDLKWHAHGRHISEDRLGLTPARLRGIAEASGVLLVFVDDDNVLEPGYLETALAIANRHPWVGAFNGSTIGEFEQEPPEAVRFMVRELAVSQVEAASWACLPGTRALCCAPCGAGMVIRRQVASAYVNKANDDPMRLSLGRTGSTLSAAEDSDMALCSCEMGLSVGVFPDLSLKHLIPPSRLQPAYLIRLAEGMSRSHAILRYIRDREMPRSPQSLKLSPANRLRRACRAFRVWLHGTPAQKFRYEIQAASARGELQAFEAIRKLTTIPDVGAEMPFEPPETTAKEGQRDGLASLL